MDGANASTDFIDETGKAVTVVNNAQINTAEKVFGSGAGLFDGISYLTFTDSADFSPGTGAFTIDFWVIPDGGGNYNVAIDMRTGDNTSVNDFAFGTSEGTPTTGKAFYIGQGALTDCATKLYVEEHIVDNYSFPLSDGGNSACSQSFVYNLGNSLSQVVFKKRTNTGTPAQNYTFSIQTDNSDKPSGTILVSTTLTAAQYNALPDGEITVSLPYNLTVGTKYWFVIDTGTYGDASNHPGIAIESTGTYSTGRMLIYISGAWSDGGGNSDMYFRLIPIRKHHIAIVGNGGADGARTIKIYINGKVGNGATITSNYNLNLDRLRVGGYVLGGGLCFSGRIDEFRFLKGEQAWTADFTPPTDAYYYVNIKTVQAKARIKKAGVTKNIQAKADIKNSVKRELQAKGSIKISNVTKIIQAKAYISRPVNQSIQARGRIQVSNIQKIISAKGSIKKFSVSSTIQVKGRIGVVSIKTIESKANIKNISSRTIQAKGSIKKFNVIQTIQAKADIVYNVTQTIQAKARIKKEGVNQTIQAKGDIKGYTKKEIQAKGSIKIFGVTQIIQSKARIEIKNVTKIIQSKANIRATIVKFSNARANIKTTIDRTIQARGRIKKIDVGRTIQAKASIKVIHLSTIFSRAKIIPKVFTTKIAYKLYQPDGTYITEISDDVISNFQINKTINGGVGSLEVILARKIDNYDEYDSVKNPTGSIKYNNRIKVYLTDRYTTNKLIFTGYLVVIAPSFSNGQEQVQLTFYGSVSKLSNDYYNTSGTPPYEPTEPAGFYVEETSVSVSTIVKNILDEYSAKVTNPMITYTWGTSIVDCANVVSYTFDRCTYLDSLKKIEEYLPVGWYWYVDATGLMNVKNSAIQFNHKLVIGKDILEIQSHKTIESIINYFILWNGRSTADAAYVFSYKDDSTSQTDYDRRILFQQDSAVVDSAVATIRKDKVIAYRKDPLNNLTIEVTGKYYDLSTLEPGQLVSIRNIRNDKQTTFVDNLVINRISYKIDSALLELSEVGADLISASSDEETAIQLSMKQTQSAIQDLQSGATPITDVNIWSGGVKFIEDTVVYSPIIAGVNGYFKESIRIGDLGVGGVIRSYGKAAFNNAAAGFWLEKSAAEKVYFELYCDANNYFRVNTNTGKVEIGGDIVMSAGSSVTWAQISGAGKPADNATVGATWGVNLSGQPLDTAIFNSYLANGSYSGGTFISGTTIYSPVIVAGSFTAKSGSDIVAIMNSAGITVNGQQFTLYDAAGTTKYGYIGGYAGYYNIATYNSRNMLLDATGGYIYCASPVVPLNDNSYSFGRYNYRWGNVYSMSFSFDNTYSISYSDSKIQLNTHSKVTGKFYATDTIDAINNFTINGVIFVGVITSGAYKGVYITGNDAVHIQGSAGSDDIKTTSTRIDVYHDIYLAGSIYLSGVVEMGTGRIRVGGTDFYVTADPDAAGKYYLRTA
jgi:hypothetical protein